MSGTFSSDFDRLYDDMIDDSSDLYCPDFSVTRRPPTHTLRMGALSNMYDQPTLAITRPDTDDYMMIPITEIDDLLKLNSVSKEFKEDISLGTRERFNDVKTVLDTFASTMTRTYDRFSNMETLTYTVPVIGFLKNSKEKFDRSFGCDSEYFKSYKRYQYHQNTGISRISSVRLNDENAPRERFIVIDGDKYSNFKVYKRHGGHFVPLNLPSDYNINDENHNLGENEQIFRVSKMSVKSDITLTLPKETELSGLSILPEKLQFEQIHSSMIRCHGTCIKSKHCISCLKNEPGYLMNFKLMFRSSLTDGKWVPLGNFTGNGSMFDSTRISFDNILVKELRIIPNYYYKSFDKIRLFPIGPCITATAVSDELFVTYVLMVPRDGKYRRAFDDVRDKKNSIYTSGCDCSRCTGRKGVYKEKCHFMREAYEGLDL